jgi:hypothetical protein
VFLPHPERAVVDLQKLRDYCLDPTHEDGKHKARVFSAALGIRQHDADWLRERLLEAAFDSAAELARIEFGVLYVIDFRLKTDSGEALVRSGWIVKTGEDFPRLTTCFVLRLPEERR